jgi:hypothetical protein
MAWGSKPANGSNAGSDGANAPKVAIGNISRRQMDDLERRSETRSDEDTAHYAALQRQSYEKRDQN